MHPALPQVSAERPNPNNRLMMDIGGVALDDEDRALLADPRVGSLILFTRNFVDKPTLMRLCADIHTLRPDLKIAVDHEGGRVQRFRAGFSEIPPMRTLGALYTQSPQTALMAARDYARLMAKELREVGVDFTFAPIVDVDFGQSSVIGNRAFARDPNTLIDLVRAFNDGLHDEGMPAIGKHFPGHGYTNADSHTELPIDDRPLSDLQKDDLRPYAAHQSIGLDAVMTAHILYPAFDSLPASFSAKWLNFLRHDLGFSGLIFSDDLSMQGAVSAGNIHERCAMALAAGCDVLLICNDRAAVRDILHAP